MVNTGDIIRTLSNIYDGVSFWKQLTVINRYLFSQKSSIVNVRLGSKYASEYYNNFFPDVSKLKLMSFRIFF